jgi:DNA-binding NarL/FixJ family response regulator
MLAAIDRGAVGFIPKSSTSDEMFAALRLVMARGIYLPRSRVHLPGTPAGSPGAAAPFGRAPAPVTPRALGLTPRQVDVLRLLLLGKPAKLIARELDVAESTVKTHTSAVLRALNVTTRTQAVVAASRMGLSFS